MPSKAIISINGINCQLFCNWEPNFVGVFELGFFFFSFTSFFYFTLTKYFLIYLKFEFKLRIDDWGTDLWSIKTSNWYLSICGAVFMYLTYLFQHSFIHLFMNKTLDKNLLSQNDSRQILNIKATSSINHDYRKFPLWQNII